MIGTSLWREGIRTDRQLPNHSGWAGQTRIDASKFDTIILFKMSRLYARKPCKVQLIVMYSSCHLSYFEPQQMWRWWDRVLSAKSSRQVSTKRRHGSLTISAAFLRITQDYVDNLKSALTVRNYVPFTHASCPWTLSLLTFRVQYPMMRLETLKMMSHHFGSSWTLSCLVLIASVLLLLLGQW